MINEFFEIARFNLSNIELEPTSVRLDRMLNQVSYEFLPMLKQKQLTIETDFTEALSIHLDVDKMQRVFDNLVQMPLTTAMQEQPSLFPLKLIMKINE